MKRPTVKKAKERQRSRRWLTLTAGLLILVALAIAFSACGGGMMGDGMGGMHGGGGQAPQTPVSSNASRVTVEMRDFDFFPRDLAVRADTSVTWVNQDAVPHDATDVAGIWGTGTLTPGERAALAFDAPGSYEYFCTIHPNMKATLTVT